MANRTIVPFGPQHPVLPEPIHLSIGDWKNWPVVGTSMTINMW